MSKGIYLKIELIKAKIASLIRYLGIVNAS